MQIEFAVGAKAARLIGRENIADVDGALIELVKNAYDADASCVWVDFSMPFPSIPEQAPVQLFTKHLSREDLINIREYYNECDGIWIRKEMLSEEQEYELQQILFSYNQIIVADNGCGMTKEVVTSSWMYIGTSNKEYDIYTKKGRVKTGAKGIGRFALDKLSRKSIMYTASETGDALKWQMDWDQFANAKLIGEVKAELNEMATSYESLVRTMAGRQFEKLKGEDWSTGTMIVLSPVREAWGERLFEKVNNNLQSINPIGSVDKFRVMVHHQHYSEYNFVTEKVAISSKDYDYRIRAEYDGDKTLQIALLRNEVNLKKKTVTIKAYDKAIRKDLSEFWSREKLQKENYRREMYDQEIIFSKAVADVLPKDSLDKIRKIGPLQVEWYFLRRENNDYEIMKRVSKNRRKKLFSQFSGIKIYRDDFKVRPYGDEGNMYDWLGMGARVQKSPAAVAHKSGSWRVQPYQMLGMVRIGRETNPNLEDMANREGIALNETYYIFVKLLQECLKVFEYDRQYIYREYAKWVKEEEDKLKSYIEKVLEAALKAAQENKKREAKEREDSKGEKEEPEDDAPTPEEMLDTVYELMKKEEKELNSKQILEVLSSSGVVINTFFHEFNAINTKFHVQAPQLRSRINYIMNGEPYTGLAAYNPFPRLDAMEKSDELVASFLDVIMEGLKKTSMIRQETSMKKMVCKILRKWERLLEEKHISLDPSIYEESEEEYMYPVALVDMYIILNNVLLNAAWFFEQGHNPERKICITFTEDKEYIYLYLENNGPVLSDRFKDNPDIIFEMGETSKKDGTGLGLWVVRETVERYNSSIHVMEEKKDGFGLCISWRKGVHDV